MGKVDRALHNQLWSWYVVKRHIAQSVGITGTNFGNAGNKKIETDPSKKSAFKRLQTLTPQSSLLLFSVK